MLTRHGMHLIRCISGNLKTLVLDTMTSKVRDIKACAYSVAREGLALSNRFRSFLWTRKSES